MYEEFTVYIDHVALHWLLPNNEPARRLIHWRLRLAEFDLEVKYKKRKANTQADALSRLNTMTEPIPNDYNNDIPIFLLDSVNLELELDKTDI